MAKREARRNGYFELVSYRGSSLTVRHIRERHEYSFDVDPTASEGIPALSLYSMQAGEGPRDVRFFAKRAMKFAEAEARRLRWL